MKIRNTKKGFTLLELLVVVLIIGILAAIALPQYRKAKEKAEASELLTNVKALNEAQHRFYLLHGSFAENFDDLDIDFSGYERSGCEDLLPSFPNIKDCLINDNSILFINIDNDKNTGFWALGNKGENKFSGFIFLGKNPNLQENKLICYELSYNTKSIFCEELFKCSKIQTYYYSCPF